MDVLNEFRLCIRRSLDIKLDKEMLYLDKTPYDVSVKTPLIFEKKPLSLLDLYILYKNYDNTTNRVPFQIYFGDVTKYKARFISTTLQREVMDYLRGRTETCSLLDLTFVDDSNEASNLETSSKSVYGPPLMRFIPPLSSAKSSMEEDLENLLSIEIPYVTRDSQVKPHCSMNFKKSIDPYLQQKKAREAHKHKATSDSIRPSVSAVKSPNEVLSVDRHTYIILLPTFRKNPINMYNVEQFLSKAQYVSSEKLRLNGEEKKETIEFDYVYNNVKYHFKCYDNYLKVQPNEWKYVACIICSQNEFQFRSIPFFKDVTSFFSDNLGIYFGYPDSALPATVRQWNVKRLDISPDNRNQDAVVQFKFWEYVMEFMNIKFH